MTKQVQLDALGITFYVTVEYEDNSVSDVLEVRIDPYGDPIKCDTECFFKSLEGELQEAFEYELQAEKDAYYDMVYEQRREENAGF